MSGQLLDANRDFQSPIGLRAFITSSVYSIIPFQIVDYYLCIHFDPTPEKIQIVRFKPAPYNPYRWAKSDSDHFRRSDPWSARDFDADVVPRSAPWEMNTTKGSPVRSGRKFAISKLA